MGRSLDRREFLRRTAVLGVGIGLLPVSSAATAEAPRVRRRVTLGRTGIEVPDIGFGGSRLRGDTELVRHALDRGITHFDTAESYTRGDSEATIGRALKGDRERVTITSKLEVGARESADSLMSRLEGSLRRLRTDRVEFHLNHAVNGLDTLSNPEWREFTERARKQGKIRWSGISGHGGRLVECVDYAVENDLADVMLVAHNFGQDPSFMDRMTRSLDFVAPQPGLPAALRRAREAGVGIIAMKTLRGGRMNDMRPYEGGGATFAQAAFRWVLASEVADSLVVTMKSREMVDEYLGASGWRRSARADLPLLAAYEARNGATQCRYGCGDCAASCPRGVEIPEVLRTRMYARDYDDEEFAREEYAKLGDGALACLDCADTPCVGACPHGIDIPSHTGPTHRLLRGSPE